jgi:hypothetical protein
MNAEREHLIKEAADDWYRGALSAFSAMTVIYSLFHPAKITAADMEWAKEECRKRGMLKEQSDGDVGGGK